MAWNKTRENAAFMSSVNQETLSLQLSPRTNDRAAANEYIILFLKERKKIIAHIQ